MICELNGIIHSKEVLMSRKQFNICKQLSTTDRRKEKE